MALVTPLVWLNTPSTPQKQPPEKIAVCLPVSCAVTAAAGVRTTFSSVALAGWHAAARNRLTAKAEHRNNKAKDPKAKRQRQRTPAPPNRNRQQNCGKAGR